MSYIGKAPGFGIRNRYYYTASSSQTLFSGADDNGQTLAYADSKYLDVYLNGVLLVAGTDYTATTLTSVTLSSGAAASDIIEIVTFSGAITVDADGATVATFDRATSDGTIVDLQKDGSTVGEIGTKDGQPYFAHDNGSLDAGILLGNSGTTARAIIPCRVGGTIPDGAIDIGYSSGRWKDLYLSGGVYLGGTGSANKIEDYEEGTWTPNFYVRSNRSQNVFTSYAVESGVYTKVGRVVSCTATVRAGGTKDNNPSNDVCINLPFTARNAGLQQGSIDINYINNFPALNDTYRMFTGFIDSNNDEICFRRLNTDGTNLNVECDEIGTGAEIYLNITYLTES